MGKQVFFEWLKCVEFRRQLGVRPSIHPSIQWLGVRCWEYSREKNRNSCLHGAYIPLGKSIQFSRSVMSDSLWSPGLQHARPPCPSPTPEVYSDSCPLSLWCHPTISFSVIPFSSCLQSFPAAGSFLMSRFFASGVQSTESFSFNVSLSNEYSGLISFRMDWLDLLAVQGTRKSLLQHHSSKALALSFLYSSTLTSIHDYWKNHSFD